MGELKWKWTTLVAEVKFIQLSWQKSPNERTEQRATLIATEDQRAKRGSSNSGSIFAPSGSGRGDHGEGIGGAVELSKRRGRKTEATAGLTLSER